MPTPLRLSPAPRQVLLFSGHRVDAADRSTPRFPAAKVDIAAAAIAAALSDLDADDRDVALTQGAAGGDILFAEACLQRGVRLALLQPLPQAQFIERSVLASAQGERWLERYRVVAARAAWPPRALPDDNPGADPFAACNRWLVDTARASGAPHLHLVCLWDGSNGDGPGGTAHMVAEVTRHAGHVTWLDTRTLW